MIQSFTDERQRQFSMGSIPMKSAENSLPIWSKPQRENSIFSIAPIASKAYTSSPPSARVLFGMPMENTASPLIQSGAWPSVGTMALLILNSETGDLCSLKEENRPIPAKSSWKNF